MFWLNDANFISIHLIQNTILIMKNLFLTMALFLFTTLAFSQIKQENKQEMDIDKLDQEPLLPTENDQERASKAGVELAKQQKEANERAQAKAKAESEAKAVVKKKRIEKEGRKTPVVK
jgi:biopolymer transport protein ExbB/TolQ